MQIQTYSVVVRTIHRKNVCFLNIRIMELEDYEDVYSLWLNTPNMGMNSLDDSKSGIAKYLLRNPNTCFVAERDGSIVGVVLSGHDGRRGYIYHAAVATTEQQQGIGTTLVGTAIAALEREGIHKVALLALRKNDAGNAYWEKQGFTTRDDLIYRNKTITEAIVIRT